MTIPTVVIVGQDGKELIINESDFNPSIHKIFGQPEPAPKVEPKTLSMKGRDSGANR